MSRTDFLWRCFLETWRDIARELTRPARTNSYFCATCQRFYEGIGADGFYETDAQCLTVPFQKFDLHVHLCTNCEDLLERSILEVGYESLYIVEALASVIRAWEDDPGIRRDQIPGMVAERVREYAAGIRRRSFSLV